MTEDAARRRYGFERCEFKRVHAHGGEREISFARVLERIRGPLRFIDLSVLAPGTEIGRHAHAEDNEELYIVVNGHGRMSLDDNEFEVKSGDVILNRPGGSHGLRNTGTEELRIVVIEVDAIREDVP
jgi:mannose-6-phosphate isomerase-like protein (cupin superfamily)